MTLEIPFDDEYLDGSEYGSSEDVLPNDIDGELRETGSVFNEETGMYIIIPRMLELF